MKSVAIDLTYKRFGQLIVKERAKKPSKVKNKKAYWLCKCDCGKERVVEGSSLRIGQTLFCGCLRNERIRTARNKEPGFTAKHALWLDYRWRARKSSVFFDITEDKFIELTSSRCHYCGKPPLQISNAPGTYLYNGLDKVNPKLGYTMDNVVPCCKKCNIAKLDGSVDEFLLWVKSVYEYNNLETFVELTNEDKKNT